MKISIVTTLYRSARHLQEFHARVSAAVAKITQDYEILLVNDGSPDDSQQVALGLCARDAHLGLLELSRNFGHHKAMMTGLAHASGDRVFLIDCDLEEAPELLQSFHEHMLQTGADVIFGVQAQRKGRWFERLTGLLFYRTFNLLSSDPIPNNILTARLMTRSYVRNLVRHREREICISGLWVITGFRQVGLPVEKLSLNPTTYNVSRKVALMVNHLTSFSNKPLVGIFYLGCVILLLSIMMGAYLVIRRLVYGLLEGWASVMVSLWFLGGLSIFCIGIVGIYLAKMFSEVKRRPYAIVRGRFGVLAAPRGRRARRYAKPRLAGPIRSNGLELKPLALDRPADGTATGSN
jgi:putative glycosyltransferase